MRSLPGRFCFGGVLRHGGTHRLLRTSDTDVYDVALVGCWRHGRGRRAAGRLACAISACSAREPDGHGRCRGAGAPRLTRFPPQRASRRALAVPRRRLHPRRLSLSRPWWVSRRARRDTATPANRCHGQRMQRRPRRLRQPWPAEPALATRWRRRSRSCDSCIRWHRRRRNRHSPSRSSSSWRSSSIRPFRHVAGEGDFLRIRG